MTNADHFAAPQPTAAAGYTPRPANSSSHDAYRLVWAIGPDDEEPGDEDPDMEPEIDPDLYPELDPDADPNGDRYDDIAPDWPAEILPGGAKHPDYPQSPNLRY